MISPPPVSRNPADVPASDAASARLLLALEACDTGLWTWDLATDAVTWTAACHRIVGLPDDGCPLTGERFFAVIDAADRALVQEQARRCIESRTPFHAEFRVHRSDGQVRWVVNHGRALYDAAGRPTQLLGSVRDVTDQKRVERAWHDSQARLRLAVEASGTGLWTWDVGTDAVTWSAESYFIHGMGEGEFEGTGEHFFRLVHPDDQARVRATVLSALAANRRYECEFRIVRPDGEILWVTNRGSARYDDAGRPVSMLGTIADVTRLKRTEERLQAALEASQTGTFRWDIVTDELAWDAALDHLFDIPPGGSVGNLASFLAHVHPEDRRGVVERCERCRTDGADFEMEYRVVRGDGSVRWIYDRGRTFRDHRGRPAWMTGACVDITGRKAAELALRHSEAFYRQALDSLPGMTFATTPDGSCDYLSEQWERFCGVPREQLLGDGWGRVVHEEDRERTVAAWRGAVEGGGRYDVEYRLRRADGEYEWFKTRGSLVRDADGRPVRWIGTAVNIHDLKLAQAERRLAEIALQDADRLKDEFLATLAHELRNLLSPMRTGLELMRRGGTAAETARPMMERQLGHMVRLVDDLLDVARVGRGHIDIRRDRIDLCMAVSHAVEACRPLLERHGHALSLALPPQPLWIEGDVTRVAQVVSNLLQNAAKYTPDGGRIGVRAASADRAVVIEVSDNGVGIPAELLPRVFDLFVQDETHRPRAGGGLGIGLAVVRKLVALHGGSVAVHSEGAGRGSVFTVRLPVAEPAAAAPC